MKALRVIAMLLALGLLFGAGRIFGLGEYTDATRLRELVSSLGPWGGLSFVLLFVAAIVAQIPAFVFVLVAPVLFSFVQAWLLCMLASNLAVLLNFELARRIGGQPLATIERPFLKRMLAGLDERPVRAVAMLRLVTIMFPPLTTTLALTNVSARDHALGSFLGLLLPVTLLLIAGTLFMQ